MAGIQPVLFVAGSLATEQQETRTLMQHAPERNVSNCVRLYLHCKCRPFGICLQCVGPPLGCNCNAAYAMLD